MIYVFTEKNSIRIVWNSAPAPAKRAANWESWRPLARRVLGNR
ncbi:hypothetical protein [Ciceribacter sp. L1K22]|nr:hypothetical protein [Ciceribacter sp. L1K22]